MPVSSQLQTLWTQFQSRYPMSGLCSELLTIHQDQFIVRAIVRVGDTTLATAMAASTDLESAEDRAKIRVLEFLIGNSLGNGTSSYSPSVTPSFLPSVPPITAVPDIPSWQNSDEPASALKSATTQGLMQEPMPLNQKTLKPELVKPEPLLDSSSTEQTLPEHSLTQLTEDWMNRSPLPPLEPNFDDLEQGVNLPESDNLLNQDLIKSPVESPLESPVELPVATVATSGSGRSTKADKTSRRKAAAPTIAEEPTTSSPNLADRSEEIMKIGIEMKRLGWSTEQGREYLKRTYGKRSRQELEDAELLDFLKYLELQPSPMQTPF